MQTDYVYLLHFSQPISPDHTCQHYLGSAEDVNTRLTHHLTGRGARLTQVANERGIDYEVVRVWKAEPGKGRELERKLKNQKNGHKLCPVCSARRKGHRPQLPLGLDFGFSLDDLEELKF